MTLSFKNTPFTLKKFPQASSQLSTVTHTIAMSDVKEGVFTNTNQIAGAKSVTNFPAIKTSAEAIFGNAPCRNPSQDL
ncbi:hypothetical protein LPYR103PRE_21130 [Segatella asaccharophila]